ncbi:hypothetical protein BpHYR1_024924 [Brachionus plicatilis]|uniref:Uncharacterized protein n=1 Tax=Brachionus plicatilis TaxID=10195 RepID=A0A3M7PDN8_BRAPC|nr:hypothetical protein BpHYR1_024924 [Brachionus plicatilis]
MNSHNLNKSINNIEDSQSIEDVQSEEEVKVYMNHIKAYHDAINEAFELNKTLIQANNTILTLKRKKLAIEQKLKTIKSFGVKKYGKKVFYPPVNFLPFNFDPIEINSTPTTPLINSNKRAATNTEETVHDNDPNDDAELTQLSKMLKY